MLGGRKFFASSGKPTTLLPAVSMSNPLLGLGVSII
jgi:hypothetical protein